MGVTMTRSAGKLRTNVSLSANTLADARALGLNVSAISDAALAKAVSAAKAKAWAEENAEALAERKEWIAKHGTELAEYQVLRFD